MTDMSGRRAIKHLLDRDVEKPVLEQLYVAHTVPTDQLRRAPKVLNAITDAFNHIAEQNFDASMLLRYMINRRKDGDWPRLGAQAQKFEPAGDLLDDSEISTLQMIYFDLDLTSDDFLFGRALIRELAHRFHGLTGRRVAGALLVAVIFAKRKRGEWPKIREAFGDIEDIANMA